MADQAKPHLLTLPVELLYMIIGLLLRKSSKRLTITDSPCRSSYPIPFLQSGHLSSSVLDLMLVCSQLLHLVKNEVFVHTTFNIVVWEKRHRFFDASRTMINDMMTRTAPIDKIRKLHLTVNIRDGTRENWLKTRMAHHTRVAIFNRMENLKKLTIEFRLLCPGRQLPWSENIPVTTPFLEQLLVWLVEGVRSDVKIKFVTQLQLWETLSIPGLDSWLIQNKAVQGSSPAIDRTLRAPAVPTPAFVVEAAEQRRAIRNERAARQRQQEEQQRQEEEQQRQEEQLQLQLQQFEEEHWEELLSEGSMDWSGHA